MDEDAIYRLIQALPGSDNFRAELWQKIAKESKASGGTWDAVANLLRSAWYAGFSECQKNPENFNCEKLA